MGFSTLGNENNGGIREIKGFDGVFVDKRRIKDMRKKEEGEKEKEEDAATL